MSAGLVWAAVAVWAALGVYVSYTDLRRAVIPRRAVWPAGAAVAVLLGASALSAGDPARLGWAAAGAASVGVMLEVAYRLRPDKMGFGDVRLIIVNSLLAGWWGLRVGLVGADGRRAGGVAGRGRCAGPTRPPRKGAVGAGPRRRHRRGGGLAAVGRRHGAVGACWCIEHEAALVAAAALILERKLPN